MNRDTKVEHIKDMPQLKKEIISYLFTYMQNKQRDKWYKYTGEFKYEGKDYTLECECRIDNEMFTYKNLHIEHKQIILEVEDVLKGRVLQ